MNTSDFGFGIFIGICISTILYVLSMNSNSKIPTAMDVYQGKTTLEYKVVDGEIVDSCVVWKSK